MKARVKWTGEPLRFCLDDVEILPEGKDIKESEVPDYWEKLLHQYAGMAMQGLMSYIEQVTPIKGCSYCDAIVDFSVKVAHALVEKLKEE